MANTLRVGAARPGYAFGAVQTSFSTMKLVVAKPSGSQMRKRYGLRFGSCGETWRTPQFAGSIERRS